MMIRIILVLGALLVAGQASIGLYGDTRSALRASRTIPELLRHGQTPAGGVIVVLQAQDCRRSGALVAHWNAVKAAGRVSVTGMVVGSDRIGREERAVLARDGVRFPLQGIARRDAEIIAEKLGYRSTPFVVVVDRYGRVAAAFPGVQHVPADALAQLVERAPS